VCKALSVVRTVRSESDEGDQTRGKQTVVGGTAPLRGGEVARVGQRGRGHYGELNSGEEAMDPYAEKGERRREGLGWARVTPVSHFGHGDGT
jgi:hypothetical protein